jgi:hypothetical protein
MRRETRHPERGRAAEVWIPPYPRTPHDATRQVVSSFLSYVVSTCRQPPCSSSSAPALHGHQSRASLRVHPTGAENDRDQNANVRRASRSGGARDGAVASPPPAALVSARGAPGPVRRARPTSGARRRRGSDRVARPPRAGAAGCRWIGEAPRVPGRRTGLSSGLRDIVKTPLRALARFQRQRRGGRSGAPCSWRRAVWRQALLQSLRASGVARGRSQPWQTDHAVRRRRTTARRRNRSCLAPCAQPLVVADASGGGVGQIACTALGWSAQLTRERIAAGVPASKQTRLRRRGFGRPSSGLDAMAIPSRYPRLTATAAGDRIRREGVVVRRRSARSLGRRCARPLRDGSDDCSCGVRSSRCRRRSSEPRR